LCPPGHRSASKVSELNAIFARLPKLGDDAETFERDIADAHAAIVPDRDPLDD
jgi:hypothetical protein